MEEAYLEIIRTIFACAGMLLTAIVMRPAIRFLKSPLPKPDALETSYSFEETEDELQIPSASDASKAYNPSSTIDFARKSPLLTAQTIRKWLKEPVSS